MGRPTLVHGGPPQSRTGKQHRRVSFTMSTRPCMHAYIYIYMCVTALSFKGRSVGSVRLDSLAMPGFVGGPVRLDTKRARQTQWCARKATSTASAESRAPAKFVHTQVVDRERAAWHLRDCRVCAKSKRHGLYLRKGVCTSQTCVASLPCSAPRALLAEPPNALSPQALSRPRNHID